MESNISIQFDEGHLTIGKEPGDYIDVLLETQGLKVQKKTYIYSDWPQLKNFFNEMANQASGWTGAMSWASVEKDFVLSATHDGLAKVNLRISLKNGMDESPWTVDTLQRFDIGNLAVLQSQL